MKTAYSALLHTHELLITLYVLLFTIKVVLLLMNNSDSLARFRKRMLVIGEMVLPTLFIATGIILAIMSKTGFGDSWFLIKMILIVLSVIAGIIAFRKNSKILAVVTLLIFIYTIMLSYIKDPILKKHGVGIPSDIENTISDPNAKGYDAVKYGLFLFKNYGCNSCHGFDGTLRNHGAANLATSTINDESITQTIRNGKGDVMNAYGKRLNPLEIHALAVFVKSLRKP